MSKLDQLAEFVQWAGENRCEVENRFEMEFYGRWIVVVGEELNPPSHPSLDRAIVSAAERCLHEARDEWKRHRGFHTGPEITRFRREYAKRLTAIIKSKP